MEPQNNLSGIVSFLISYIESKQVEISVNKKLLDIQNGNLNSYVEESLSGELNPRAFARTKNRIPPININKKIVDKLSKVYKTAPVRSTSNTIDSGLINYYEQQLELNTQLAGANELLNLHRCFALEPYLDKGYPSLRVLPADRFLVWSDDPIDPTNVTVFIKFMGNIRKKVGNGKQVEYKSVPLYSFYSNDWYLSVDHEGQIYQNQPNPYGKIPFVYCSSSSYELLPKADSDSLSMTILIPKLLADLNYSVQFMSRSIVYGIDIEIGNLDNNPDSFWSISSIEGENKSPQLNTIKPEVDIQQTIELISFQVKSWLETRGIKSSSFGNSSEVSASGISKVIEEGDSSDEIAKQKVLFAKFEDDLWQLIKTMHSFWIQSNLLNQTSADFSLSFKPSVKFADNKIVTDMKTTLEEIKMLNELNLISKKQSIKKLFPNMSDKQVNDYLKELEDGNEEELSN